jgi:two-component system sensor histidine kinase KdpD
VGDQIDVAVDPEMIEMALMTVLENALRFAPPETDIVVVARPVDHRDSEIRVIDHGPGIAAADRGRIFDEFVRLGDPTDTSGSGIGLAIARAFVDAHGGRIWAEPTTGGGATFVIWLPCGEAPS